MLYCRRPRAQSCYKLGEGLGEGGGAWNIESFQFWGIKSESPLAKYLSKVVAD
jgi:hypothetical protein